MKDFSIGGVTVKPGKRVRLELEAAHLFDYTSIGIPVEVVRGREDGPVLFVCAAIHGDEINGVETIKKLLAKRKTLSQIKGTLIAVPVVNVFGFNSNQRLLPDRRDLNRCFPGSEKGSLASRIAHTFMTEVVEKCTHGIDLHTGSNHRKNIPQIRACLSNPENHRLAHEFGVPVLLDSSVRDGSLRQAVHEMGIPMLLFEGGEALRYDPRVISSALHGILNVMVSIGMLEETFQKRRVKHDGGAFVANSSHWVRAPSSGSLRTSKKLGDMVRKGERLGVITDPFGSNRVRVKSGYTGVIIGVNQMPLVNTGDALIHIATFSDHEEVYEQVENFEEFLDSEAESE